MKYSKAKTLKKVYKNFYEKANNFKAYNISGFLSLFSARNCLVELIIRLQQTLADDMQISFISGKTTCEGSSSSIVYYDRKTSQQMILIWVLLY